MSAGRIQERLDKESRKWWSARAVKEYIVLMDWDCTEAKPNEELPIAILKNILEAVCLFHIIVSIGLSTIY